MGRLTFIASQRAAQAAYFARTAGSQVRDGAPYRLSAGRRDLNLTPGLRDVAEAYFGEPRKIAWHRHADHGLSSQVCCLNFLGPLATQPDLLSQIIGNVLEIAPPLMLPVEDGPHGVPWYVGFEWPGQADYLGEWKPGATKGQRGQNATNADAIVRFEHDGQIETLLIEWKYTEVYGARLDPKGNATRISRYADLAFSPTGPLRADLDLNLVDFFWEPFYQLLRQQMLALRMECAQEGRTRSVRVLHISPSANLTLHKVTAPALRRFGDDAFDVFRKLLVKPDRFISRTIEQVFAPFVASDHAEPAARAWARYLSDRYCFLKANN
ncbi:hypothetical protein BH10PSE11_BH10PSE11_20620 [soil metagenome]